MANSHDDQAVGKNMVRKFVTRKFGEEIDKPLQMGKNCQGILFHVNAYQRVTSAKEDLNN